MVVSPPLSRALLRIASQIGEGQDPGAGPVVRRVVLETTQPESVAFGLPMWVQLAVLAELGSSAPRPDRLTPPGPFSLRMLDHLDTFPAGNPLDTLLGPVLMTPPLPSPPITHLSWGRIDVAGHGTFKDVKLFSGGARAWDWNETGTSHSPGIQPEDVEELLANGAEVVVLGTGMLGRLKVRRKTLGRLEEEGVETIVLETEAAVKRYNDLRETKAVGALLHSTC